MLYSFFCRLSCDKEVVRMIRGRTLGNSATALYRQLCQAQRAVGFPVSSVPLCVWEVYIPRHRPQPSRCPDATDGTCALPGMAAVSIRKRCTDTAPRTKGQGHLNLWLHPKYDSTKKVRRTQTHNLHISRDAGFPQYLFKSYFRSLRVCC